jgi:hypothetical protein
MRPATVVSAGHVYCGHICVKLFNQCHSVALFIAVPACYSQWAEAMLALVEDR